ncbi:MAG: hypothetical protein AAFY75_09735 [Pseudomonadota bacterium]
MITMDDLQGHWRRDWIKAPGFEDHSTAVHWLQAGDLYADIRIPAERPDLCAYSCLADVPQDMFAPLLNSEGFAGTIEVSNNRCIWRREINWQGVPEMDDIGLMSFTEQGLIEDGVLADYRELWQAEPTAPLRGHRIAFGEMSGILVENDAEFLVGLGRPPAPASGRRAQFASTYVLGHWDGADGVATLSTNPFCEGQIVLRRDAGFTWHAPSFDGAPADFRLNAA